MTVPPPSTSSFPAAAAAAAPKVAPPPLETRAPRPSAVRVRRSVVALAVLSAAALLAGAFAWAFVIQPELRAEARGRDREQASEGPEQPVRPSEAITDGPASYGSLDRLPPPRGPGEDDALPAESVRTPPTRVSSPDYGAQGAAGPIRSPGVDAVDPTAEARRSDLFFEPRMGSTGAGTGDAPASSPTAPAPGPAPRPETYNPHGLEAPLSPFELKAGALLPAALLTAIDTGRPGPVVAVVTAPAYDTVSGRHLLIPQGTRLIGRHEGESRYGDRRAFLVWERLILPNGNSLVLDEEAGVDAQGAVGLEGRVDRRLGALVTATLFGAAVTTLGTIARDREPGSGSLWSDAGDAAAIEGSRVGGRLVERELEVRPTITLRPGALVRVLITRDLILEPYRP
ncbi:TrbI/VirB10 family protein [Brevundimonas staleyi]|uniref:TrbI/VirB10 family protein n=1 Tax=Brevundimonas staleyi TaxID=74326 RepID=A0ABW0FV40_9CAUL